MVVDFADLLMLVLALVLLVPGAVADTGAWLWYQTAAGAALLLLPPAHVAFFSRHP